MAKDKNKEMLRLKGNKRGTHVKQREEKKEGSLRS